MQLSYKVIEDSKVIESDIKVVETKYKPQKPDNDKKVKLENNIIESNVESNLIEKKYNDLAEKIIKNAQTQSNNILKEAYVKAEKIKKEAYKEAYELGEEKGYEDGYVHGYEESYKKNIEIAKDESEVIINEANEVLENANDILLKSKYTYAKYLEKKKDEIKELVLTAVESILKKEVLNEDAVNNMVFEAISIAKDSEIIIIKCNNKYIDEINNQLNNWKCQLAFSGEIFVIEDNTISDGNILIEKNNGRILVGIDIGLSKVKDILYGNGE